MENINKILVEKLHTTELGMKRIIKNPNSNIIRKGKNWYVTIDGCIITINAYSYTIITAHKEK